MQRSWGIIARSLPTRGRPFRKVKLHHPVHLAQLAPAPVLQVQELRQLQLELPLASGVEDITPLKRSGWTPLPKTQRADLPFEISRTVVGQALPVYIDYKGHGTKAVTQVRKVTGDVEKLAKDLQKVCDGRPVHVKPGRLEIDGNYSARVKAYLTALGF